MGPEGAGPVRRGLSSDGNCDIPALEPFKAKHVFFDQPLSANLNKSLGGRVYFVPEGQPDSSQARSAWDYEENSLVPAGRLNRSWLKEAA